MGNDKEIRGLWQIQIWENNFARHGDIWSQFVCVCEV